MASDNPTVAPYAKTGEVHLRITARAATPEAAQALIGPRETALRERLGDVVYGVDNETLEGAVVGLLKDAGPDCSLLPNPAPAASSPSALPMFPMRLISSASASSLTPMKPKSATWRSRQKRLKPTAPSAPKLPKRWRAERERPPGSRPRRQRRPALPGRAGGRTQSLSARCISGWPGTAA